MERILRERAERELLLGTFLSQTFGLTHRQISQAKFRDRGICVNGIQRRVNYPLQSGDVVEVRIESQQKQSDHLVPTEGRLKILWEDPDLLIVNKPAGLVMHPSHGHYQDTLANQVWAYGKSKSESFVVRAVGRLDQETSGIVLFAKNQVAAARLSAQRKAGILSKTYLALVSGRLEPPAGLLSLPMRKQPGHRMKMEALPEGIIKIPSEEIMEAATSYHVLDYADGYSITEVTIQTGRTHQIRVHFSALGYPLLGDSLYGTQENKNRSISRTALHAWKVKFVHPFQNQKLCLEAPIPQDICCLLPDDIITKRSIL